MRSIPDLPRRAGSGAPARPCVPTWFLPGLTALVLAAAPFAVRGDEDLPGRVGRIADFAGELYLAPQDAASEWAAIGINYPVTSGDNLWVSGDGRAEVDYGGGQFRLAGDTNLHVSRLDDRQLALFVAQGRLIVRVRVLDTGDEARVDTPNTQVTLTRPGLYRIDVTPGRQTTTLTVREGEGFVGLATGAQQALPGQSVTVTGQEPLASDVQNGSGVDGFDTWSANRDRRYERGRSTAYVSRQMVGYAELDEYGEWENNSTYGAVWYPTVVAADWAPYRDGYWTAVGAWGLTWVDSAPWGYAPSHYGRWVKISHRWAWCPGSYVARPHWAPALVAWYGGARWGLAANAGAPVYGWVPLGWGDAYLPSWHRCSHNCWAHYNRGHAVNLTSRPHGPLTRYSNMGVPGAMTAVTGATLLARKPVQANMVPFPASLGMSAPLLATAPAIPAGPSHVPALRPGERGTPMPASVSSSTAWRGAAVGTPHSKPPPMPGATIAPRPGSAAPARGPSGIPFTAAPTTRPAPAGTPSAAQDAPPPRGGAPSAALPVAASPAQPQPQMRPTPNGAPALPPASAQPPGRAGSLGAGGLAFPAPAATVAPTPAGRSGSLGAGGLALPAPTAPVAPMPVGRSGSLGAVGLQLPAPAATVAPMPSARAVTPPSLGQPGPAVGTPPPAPVMPAASERPSTTRAEADAAKPGKPVDKIHPGGSGTVPR